MVTEKVPAVGVLALDRANWAVKAIRSLTPKVGSDALELDSKRP